MQVRRRIAVESARPAALFVAVVAGTILLDQLSKAAIRASLEPYESIPLIEGVLHVTHVRNTGAAFGLMPGYRPLFLATAFVVIIGVAVYWRRERPRAIWLVTALGLMVAGAAGNLVDRAGVGKVTDFIDFQVFPVFNIADSAIIVGVAMLIVWVVFGPEGAEESPSEPEERIEESLTDPGGGRSDPSIQGDGE